MTKTEYIAHITKLAAEVEAVYVDKKWTEPEGAEDCIDYHIQDHPLMMSHELNCDTLKHSPNVNAAMRDAWDNIRDDAETAITTTTYHCLRLDIVDRLSEGVIHF